MVEYRSGETVLMQIRSPYCINTVSTRLLLWFICSMSHEVPSIMNPYSYGRTRIMAGHCRVVWLWLPKTPRTPLTFKADRDSDSPGTISNESERTKIKSILEFAEDRNYQSPPQLFSCKSYKADKMTWRCDWGVHEPGDYGYCKVCLWLSSIFLTPLFSVLCPPRHSCRCHCPHPPTPHNLTWPVMTGCSRGSKISRRKRCKPTRKSEERAWKHTGACQTQLPFSRTRWPLFHLCRSTMRLSDTKLLSTLPEYSGNRLLTEPSIQGLHSSMTSWIACT